MKSALILLFLPLLAVQEDALKVFDPDDMKEVLTKLASDEFEGRRTGSKGIRKARAYLAGLMKDWGLKPVGDSFQFPPKGIIVNMVAVHRGSDPKLKDEVILVAAHYDHLGKGRSREEEDKIHNGADDNASGTTAVLFLAKALAQGKVKTKRTIVFLLTSGEEQGKNGAKQYAQKPAFPLDKTVAMVNCDMIGRNPEKPASLFGVGTSPQFGDLVKKAVKNSEKANVKPIDGKGSLFHRTDAVIFWSRKIPSMFLFTGMHPDYHKVTDHADKIDYARLSRLGKFLLRLVVELADHDGKFEFVR